MEGNSVSENEAYFNEFHWHLPGCSFSRGDSRHLKRSPCNCGFLQWSEEQHRFHEDTEDWQDHGDPVG